MAQSQEYIREAIACGSEVAALKLVDKYEKSKDQYKQLYKGILFHNLAVKGNKNYIEKAINNCQEIFEETKYPLALGYLGSSLPILAGQYFQDNDRLSAMGKLQEGFSKMYQAIQMGGENLELRRLRLIHSLQVSKASPYDRFHKIEEDLIYLNSKWTHLSSEDKSLFYLFSGLVEQKKNNIKAANNCFKKAMSVSPNSFSAKQAEKQIDKNDH